MWYAYILHVFILGEDGRAGVHQYTKVYFPYSAKYVLLCVCMYMYVLMYMYAPHD